MPKLPSRPIFLPRRDRRILRCHLGTNAWSLFRYSRERSPAGCVQHSLGSGRASHLIYLEDTSSRLVATASAHSLVVSEGANPRKAGASANPALADFPHGDGAAPN